MNESVREKLQTSPQKRVFVESRQPTPIDIQSRAMLTCKHLFTSVNKQHFTLGVRTGERCQGSARDNTSTKTGDESFSDDVYTTA